MELLSQLNPDQIEAVTWSEGPLLVLAGSRQWKDQGAHYPCRLSYKEIRCVAPAYSGDNLYQ